MSKVNMNYLPSKISSEYPKSRFEASKVQIGNNPSVISSKFSDSYDSRYDASKVNVGYNQSICDSHYDASKVQIGHDRSAVSS